MDNFISILKLNSLSEATEYLPNKPKDTFERLLMNVFSYHRRTRINIGLHVVKSAVASIDQRLLYIISLLFLFN